LVLDYKRIYIVSFSVHEYFRNLLNYMLATRQCISSSVQTIVSQKSPGQKSKGKSFCNRSRRILWPKFWLCFNFFS